VGIVYYLGAKVMLYLLSFEKTQGLL